MSTVNTFRKKYAALTEEGARTLPVWRLGSLPLFCICISIVAATAPIAHAQELQLDSDWRIQSSSVAGADGARISSTAYVPAGWYPATVPSTIVGALVDDGVYADLFQGVEPRAADGA